jgi:hypothetical protein
MQFDMVERRNCYVVLGENSGWGERTEILAWVEGVEDKTTEGDGFGGKVGGGEDAQGSG